MTLTRALRAGGIIALLLLFALIALFAGNQRQANAAVPSSGEIICRIFTTLTNIGSPIPILHGGDCPDEPPPPPPPPACSDGIDNDGDNRVDSADPGCSGANDTDEADTPSPPPAACSDGVDNDGDGLIDTQDPGCSNSSDTDETNAASPGVETTLALCSDGIDNDNDGQTDLNDADCVSFKPKLVVVKVVINDNGGTSAVSDFSLHIATSSEGTAASASVTSGATTTVSVGTWTVWETQKAGYTATFGGDCSTSGQVTLAAGQTKTCTITNNDVAPSALACADGIDNDGDGQIDSADPGCSGSGDNDETDPPVTSGGTSATAAPGPGVVGGGPPVGLFGGFSLATTTGGGGMGTGGIVLGASTTTESCERYITAFIRMSQQNDVDQVKRLQKFLRDYESAKLAETGTYDGATLAAVHAFQTKYDADILSPWGTGRSTGYVYLTTRKKINEIVCRNTRTFFLTPDELKKIAEVRAASVSEPVQAPSSVPQSSISTGSVVVPQEVPMSKVATGTTTQDKTGAIRERACRLLQGKFDFLGAILNCAP